MLRAVDRGQGGVAPLSRSEATLKPRRGQTTIVCVADNSGFEPPLKKVDETPEACYTISQGNIPRKGDKEMNLHEHDRIRIKRTHRNTA